MDLPSRSEWEKIVCEVATVLDAAHVAYHVDASSSLYFHGIDFEMDDLDITVKWGAIELARELFAKFSPTGLCVEYPPSFRFNVDGKLVHVMSYRSDTGLGDPADRVTVAVGNSVIWSKTVDYYQRNLRSNHPLKEALKAYSQLAGKGL